MWRLETHHSSEASRRREIKGLGGVESGALLSQEGERLRKNSAKRVIEVMEAQCRLEMKPRKGRSYLIDGAWSVSCSQRG